MFRMTKTWSFVLDRRLGKGWRTDTLERIKLDLYRKHFDRMHKQGALAGLSNGYWRVYVTSTWFGLKYSYRVENI